MQTLPKLPQALPQAALQAVPQALPQAVHGALLTQSLGKRMEKPSPSVVSIPDKFDRWVISRLLASPKPLGLEPCSLAEFNRVWEQLFLPTRANVAKARAIEQWRKLALAYVRAGMGDGVKRAAKEICNAL